MRYVAPFSDHLKIIEREFKSSLDVAKNAKRFWLTVINPDGKIRASLVAV